MVDWAARLPRIASLQVATDYDHKAWSWRRRDLAAKVDLPPEMLKTQKIAPGTTKQRKARFLRAFKETRTILGAVNLTKINRRTHAYWMTHDPEYAKSFEEVAEDVADEIESEALRRAVDGWEEPVTCGARLVYDASGDPVMKRVYSDRLMEKAMVGWKKERYSERREMIHHSTRPATVNVQIGTLLLQVLEPFPEARAALASKLAELGADDQKAIPAGQIIDAEPEPVEAGVGISDGIAPEPEVVDWSVDPDA